jgi:hypothetical protein
VQKGRIYRKGRLWMLQYWEPVLENGKPAKRRVAQKLTSYSDQYRTEQSVRPLADLILAPINARLARPESTEMLAAFLEHVYLPQCQVELRPSTYRSYLVMFRLLEPHLRGLALRDIGAAQVHSAGQWIALALWQSLIGGQDMPWRLAKEVNVYGWTSAIAYTLF